MKNLIKKLFAVVLITLILSCSLIPALAATLPDINAKTERIESLEAPSGYSELNCKATQSLSVTSSGNNKRLFVVRIKSKDKNNTSNNTDDLAMLYMYKNYKDISEGYGVFLLKNLVGHANGMAIDDKYIYITCWDDDDSDGNTNELKIVRIKRQKLWELYKKKETIFKEELDANSSGVTIMPVVDSNGVGYTKKIYGITYYKDEVDEEENKTIKSFIINTKKTFKNDTYYLNFTKAEISDNGTPNNDQDDYLIVSDSATDKFQVVFNDAPNTSGQDIGYDPDCGLFIVRSYKEKITYVDENGKEKEKYVPTTENVIIWVKLDSLPSENRIYTPNSYEYRIINVNKSSNIFKHYELESVSIGSDNHMYASVNVELSDSSYTQYKLDPIIKITRPNSSQFFESEISV